MNRVADAAIEEIEAIVEATEATTNVVGIVVEVTIKAIVAVEVSRTAMAEVEIAEATARTAEDINQVSHFRSQPSKRGKKHLHMETVEIDLLAWNLVEEQQCRRRKLPKPIITQMPSSTHCLEIHLPQKRTTRIWKP